MNDSDLIDVETINFLDDQVWLQKTPNDRGDRLDAVDWCLSLDWPVFEDEEYDNTEKKLYDMFDNILNKQVSAMPDKHKFDSRTYVKPKRRVTRPSIQQIVEVASPPNTSPLSSLNNNNNKYLTYNKYCTPLGPILRHKTFNVDTNTDNSNAIKEALKRRSLVPDDGLQQEDLDSTLIDVSERLSSDHGPTPSKPISIDLSQPAHNLHNTFNKGLPNMMLSDRGSLNMYQSGESLMRMSPPSLVSSLMMETSGNFNTDSMDSKKLQSSLRDSGPPTSCRESIDPMMTSMTLSILDEKDMSTSFLSQTTHPDDSIMDLLPPSLVSSVNSSYTVKGKMERDINESTNNVFSSATFTHLEQSERLLSARPRCGNMYNSLRSSAPRNSESYTKSKEEACQIDQSLVSNENGDKSIKDLSTSDEQITLHYSNNKFRKNKTTGKENVNASFDKDDAFYRETVMTRTVDLGKNTVNATMDKQELNEIIQARQKLLLARRGMPGDSVPLPNQVDTSPARLQRSPNHTLTGTYRCSENTSDMLARRRVANGLADTFDKEREPPKRNATFRRPSPDKESMGQTVVFLQDKNIIDINSATLDLVDDSPRPGEEWGCTERAMVGSSESTDTATCSSVSPPESVPTIGTRANDLNQHVSSTPLTLNKGYKSNLMNLHTTISPIFNPVDDKSYTLTKAASNNSNGTYDVTSPNATVISGTIVKNTVGKRDIAGRTSPEARKLKNLTGKMPTATVSQTTMVPPSGLFRKSGLPTSKLRQYSSHKDLRIPVNNGATNPVVSRAMAGRLLVRRNVYGSNPALSPTAPPQPPLRRDSYTIATEEDKANAKPVPVLVRQGTETLRRERPHSQLVQPRDLRGPGSAASSPMRYQRGLSPPSRDYSTASATQPYMSRPQPKPNVAGPPSNSEWAAPAPAMRQQRGYSPPARAYCTSNTAQPHVIRPASQPAPKQYTIVSGDQRPASSEGRSALPRPSRLPGPRRGLRPPSVYSVAPAADMDHY